MDLLGTVGSSLVRAVLIGALQIVVSRATAFIAFGICHWLRMVDSAGGLRESGHS